MPEGPFWHGSKPAPDQTVVGRWRFKSTFEKDRPEIRNKGCAQPNQDCAKEIIHETPVSWF
jgi:hypothetical protein